jgi:hypothetical protein
VALCTTTALLQSGCRGYALSPCINRHFSRPFVGGRPLLLLSLRATKPLEVDWVENTAARNEESSSPSSKSDDITSVSLWHRERRRQMILKYGDQIARLERDDSQFIGVPLLLLSCASLWGLTILCGSLPVWAVVLLAAFPGSMFSLWQLQLLHDVIHGSFLQKDSLHFGGIPRKRLQEDSCFGHHCPASLGTIYT